MRIKLTKKFIKRMVEQRESGMGYQKVAVKLKDGKVVAGFVYDSTILDVNEFIDINGVDDIEVVN